MVVETTTQSVQNGMWTWDSPALADGMYTIEVEATDAAGNQSSATQGFEVDTMGPALTVDMPLDGSQSAILETTISGTSEPGISVTVVIKDNAGNIVQTLMTTADMQGNWTIDAAALIEGDYTLEVVAEDDAGNTSNSGVISFRIDKSAPMVSITSPLEGVVGNMTQPTISGSAEAGAEIEVTIKDENGSIVFQERVIVDANGQWTASLDSRLADGEYEISVKATDAAGNTSQPILRNFKVDTMGPVVSIETPASDSQRTDTTPTIEGKAEPNSVVEIFIDGEKVGESMTDAMGMWTFTLMDDDALTLGDHRIEAKSKDPVGNEGSSGELTITIVEEMAAIVISSGGTLEGPEVTITGNATLGSEVVVEIDRQTQTVDVDEEGHWSATFDNVGEGEQVLKVSSQGEEVSVDVEVKYASNPSPRITVSGGGCSSLPAHAPLGSLLLFGVGVLILRIKRRR